MPKKPVKQLDPAWLAEHRKDRHRLKTAVTVRIEPETKAVWQAAAARQKMTLRDWVIAACHAFAEGEGSSATVAEED